MSIERARELLAHADSLRIPTPRQGETLEDIRRAEFALEVRKFRLMTEATIEAGAAAQAATADLITSRQRRKWWSR